MRKQFFLTAYITILICGLASCSSNKSVIDTMKDAFVYRTDEMTFGITGGEFAKGPNGDYGKYEILESCVSPGMDPENRLAPGKIFYFNKNGQLVFTCGHTGNEKVKDWWASHIEPKHIAHSVHPKGSSLSYAMRGTLTLYLRGRSLSAKSLTKVVIDDFYICHGKQNGKQMFLWGAPTMLSKSVGSIMKEVLVKEKTYRMYMEINKKDKEALSFTINPVKERNSEWMKPIPDSTPIARLTIPGTHDSGTAAVQRPSGLLWKLYATSHCQNFQIVDQIKDGIRFFDMRLKSSMSFGHTFNCDERFDETIAFMADFLKKHPSEMFFAMIGSDESKKWSPEMIERYDSIINAYRDIMVDNFKPSTPLGKLRGKIVVIRRQPECPFGKLIQFEDNATFHYDFFDVEDEYKKYKAEEKLTVMRAHLREAFENDKAERLYITFANIAWYPQKPTPFQQAWSVKNAINPSLREMIEDADCSGFGVIMLDYYNRYGDRPHVVESIIEANYKL